MQDSVKWNWDIWPTLLSRICDPSWNDTKALFTKISVYKQKSVICVKIDLLESMYIREEKLTMYSVCLPVRFPYMSWAFWLILALLDNKWRDMSLVGYRAVVGSPGPIIAHFFFSLLNCEMWVTSSLIHQDISSWSWCRKKRKERKSTL